MTALALMISGLAACGGAEDRKAKYFERGKELFEEGNYVKAELEFKNVLQIDPKHADAWYMLGRAAEKQQEWRNAFGAYAGALEADAEHVPAMVAQGHLYRLSGAHDKALEAAKTALGLAPGDADALILRGATRAQLGESEAAVADARAALRSDPDNVRAISLTAMFAANEGKLDEAIGLVEQGVEKHPKDISLQLLLVGLYEKKGDTAQAVEMLRRLIGNNPDDLKFRLQLASYYARKDDRESAEQVLREAIEAMPESAQAKLALADFLAKNGDASAAEQALRDFIKTQPENYELHFGLAKLYMGTGKAAQAKKVYEGMITADDLGPSGLRARTRLAELLLAEGERVEAGELVAMVLKENPKDTDALIVRAMLALLHKDPDQAITDVRTVLGGIPNDPRATRLLAQGHLQKNEVTLAREALEKGVKASPKDVALSLDLARVLVATGDSERAMVVLKNLVEAVPDNYSAARTLGNLQIAQQRWEALKELAQLLKQKQPDNPLGYYFMGIAHRGQKAPEKSVKEFEQALAFKPDAIQALVELSKSYLALQQPEKALAQIEKVLAGNPDNLAARDLKGEIYLQQKRYAEAEAVFKEIIAANPKWPTPYRNLYSLYRARQDQERALTILREGVEATDDTNLRFLLAGIHERRREGAQAKVQYEAILAKAPQSVLAANNLAMLLANGEPDQAALDRALELVKGFDKARNPLLVDTLGWVRYQRGEYEEAVALLERASAGAAKFPIIDYHLGLTYLKLGKPEQARASLDRALQSGVAFAESADAKKVREGL